MGGYLSKSHKRGGVASSSRPMIEGEGSFRQGSALNHWHAIASSYSKSDSELRLRPEYVFGYTTSATTNSLFYLSAEIIVYPCCAVAVLLNTGNNTQLFLGSGDMTVIGHSQTICAIAVSMDKTVVATGDKGLFPLICCWKPGESLRPMEVFELAKGSEGTAILAFSSSSRFLAALDLSHILSLYDWRHHRCLLTLPSPPLIGLSWSPLSLRFAALSPSACSFYSYHDHTNSLQIEHMKEDRNRENRVGPEWLSDGSAVSGDKVGNLVHWLEGGKALKTHRVIEDGKEITALRVVRNAILVGGVDCVIRELNATFRLIRLFNVPSTPISIDLCEDSVLVGIAEGIILEFGRNGRLVLMDSHAGGRLEGAAIDPETNSTLLTVGSDNKFKCWSLIQHRALFSSLLEVSFPPASLPSPTAIAISPHGYIAVGHCDGHITIRKSMHESNVIIALLKEGEVGVKVLEFSKTGQWLAVGCANGTVNVYHMQTDIALLCTFQHGFDAITGLYWSNSSLLSIDLNQTSHQWSLAENPDIEIPLWPPLPSQIVCGARVLCVKQAQEGPYIAVGNEWGLLELRIPNKDLPIAYRFHANAITSLYWCSNDHQIVTISADDQSVVLWSVLQG